MLGKLGGEGWDGMLCCSMQEEEEEEIACVPGSGKFDKAEHKKDSPLGIIILLCACSPQQL